MSKDTIDSIVDILSSSQKEPEIAATVVREKVIQGTASGHEFVVLYAEYKRIRKPDLLLSIIGQYISGPVAVDIGAGDCTLVARLLKYMERVKRVIATDILSRENRVLDERIEFRLHPQSNFALIPVDPQSADTVMLINVLHHIPAEEVPSLLSHVRECLHDGGTLIVLEDTYSMSSPPLYDVAVLLPRFMILPDENKQQILRFMDWYSTRVAEGVLGMRYPFNFNTLETWVEILELRGFRSIDARFLGLCPGSFHAIPKGLLIAKS